MNLSPSIEWDLTLRGVAALSSPAVPAYRTADVRIGWRPLAAMEISLSITNLGDGGHGEFSALQTRTEVGRSGHLGLRWQFGAL
jgi:iron complex outermembrane receptor protein